MPDLAGRLLRWSLSRSGLERFQLQHTRSRQSYHAPALTRGSPSLGGLTMSSSSPRAGADVDSLALPRRPARHGACLRKWAMPAIRTRGGRAGRRWCKPAGGMASLQREKRASKLVHAPNKHVWSASGIRGWVPSTLRPDSRTKPMVTVLGVLWALLTCMSCSGWESTCPCLGWSRM